MTHLGAKLSALADGQLSPSATERALAHVAGCLQCASELAAAREARRALSAACDVLPTTSLNDRLLALAHSDELQSAGCLPSPRTTQPHAFGESALAPGAHDLRGSVVRRGVTRYVLTGSAVAAGVFFGSLLALGARPALAPETAPSEALDVLGRSEGARSAGSLGSGVPGSDLSARVMDAVAGHTPTGAESASPVDHAVLAWMEDNGWVCPRQIPPGYAVTAVRLVPDQSSANGTRLEVDLDSPDGRLVLLEREGRLDSRALAGYPTFEVDGRVVHVLQSEPWRAVWQARGTVVEVVADTAAASAQEFVAGFPHTEYDDGIPARLGRGWATMTGALSQ